MESKQFQIVDVVSDDILFELGNRKKEKRFIITLYGINEHGDRIVCHVNKYYPYFYLKVPNDPSEWTISKCTNFLKAIQVKSRKDLPMDSLKEIKASFSKDFYGFQWDFQHKKQKENLFYQIIFKNHASMKNIIQDIRNYYHDVKLQEMIDPSKSYSDWLDVDTSDKCDSNIYESFVHPVMRFIHDSKIEPTGWIECHCNNRIKTKLFAIDEYSCDWSPKRIYPIDNSVVSQYVIASFDIECDSLHGDFPLPKKNYKKLASNVFDSLRSIYDKLPKKNNFTTNHKELMIDNLTSYLYNLLLIGFEDIEDLEPIYKYASIQRLKITNDISPSDDIIELVVKTISNTMIESMTLSDLIRIKKLIGKQRDTFINSMQKIMDKIFHKNDILIEGDPIIQIGTVFHRYGEKEPYLRHILVIGPEENMKKEDICDSMEDIHITVQQCFTEKELLLEWSKIIQKEDPEFITGYNIFGFDFRYIQDRVSELFTHHQRCHYKWGCNHKCECNQFYNMGKINSTKYEAGFHTNKKCSTKNQKLASSALGENDLNYIMMDGRILFDIQKEVQKGHNLESYKLDNVASHFMRGKIKAIDDLIVTTDNIGHLKEGDYISFRLHSNIGEELYRNGTKIKIIHIEGKQIELADRLEIDLSKYKVEWCLNKDDITPQDIFDKYKQIEGGSKARAEVAKYCIQDCELCINLLLLLDIIPNNLAMANVSYVPASYIFLRGQGVKVTSVVSRMCSLRNTRMPDLKKPPAPKEYIKMIRNGSSKEEVTKQIIADETNNQDPDPDKHEMYKMPKEYQLEAWYEEYQHQTINGMDGYEGAIVLDPEPGIYTEPVAVLDYGSLYPSSIIEKNVSHETLIEDVSILEQIGEENYYTVTYDNWVYKGKGKGDTIEKVINEKEKEKICHFIKPSFMERHGCDPIGIIPAVLNEVLDARKRTKKLMKSEKDEFKYKVLDGLQLAYKVTANSVYGQLGARTSTICKLPLAACTTSIGRERLTVDATEGVKEWALKEGYEEPQIVYGDTDSVFVKFSCKDKSGTLLKDTEALQHTIDCGLSAEKFIQAKMNKEGKQPQVLEYEKTFWPFILISKKRYTGDKYEFNTTDKKRTAMGIVLKRRDNAPIVKYVFGHVIEKIMIDRDFDSMLQWLKETLQMIRSGEFDLSKFIITKSLRGYYKNPQQIAHKVLADRMAERDPGNKPKSNDRIPYAYIQLKDEQLYDYENPYKSGIRKGEPREKNVMQGDRIEHVDHILKKKLKLDYEFYITNQIMNPVKQVLDLHLDPSETEKLFLL